MDVRNRAQVTQAVGVLGLIPEETTVQQMDVFVTALNLFDERNNSDAGYEDLWALGGWEDSILHMRSKLARLEARFIKQNGANKDLDDAYDLLNYVAFFIRNVLAGRQHG